MATNVVSSRPPKRRPTGTLHARAKTQKRKDSERKKVAPTIAQTKSIKAFSTATPILTLNNNAVCDNPTPVAAATPSLTDLSWQPSADTSSALIPPNSLCTQPHPQETPRSPTPHGHGVPIFTEEVDNTSVDMKEYENTEYSSRQTQGSSRMWQKTGF